LFPHKCKDNLPSGGWCAPVEIYGERLVALHARLVSERRDHVNTLAECRHRQVVDEELSRARRHREERRRDRAHNAEPERDAQLTPRHTEASA
jgi:hypothetical protein